MRAVVGWLLLASVTTPALAQDRPSAVALLRWNPAGAPYVQMFLEKPITPGETVEATLFSDGKAVERSKPATPLVIDLVAVPDKMTVIVTRTGAGAPEQFAVAVGMDLSFKLGPNVVCDNELGLSVIRRDIPDEAVPYANARMHSLLDAISNKDSARRTRFTLQIDPADRLRLEPEDDYAVVAHVPNLSSRDFMIGSGGFSVCLSSAGRWPIGEFDARLVGLPAIPEFRDGVVGTKLTVTKRANAPTVFSTTDAPGDRQLERNLDAAILGTSSLAKPDADGKRERTSVATLDLRLAPWLNTLAHGRRAIGHTLKYFTPVFIDAKVSTGDLTKDTTSINTIVVGSEFEFRRFPAKLVAPVSFHRYIVRVASVANRDYSHAELGGAVEWKPVLAALTRPIQVIRYVEPAFDPDPDRRKAVRSRFGFEISPVVGVEFGATTRWEDPPADVENPPDFVRLHLGVESKVEITRRFVLNTQLQSYVRSEKPEDRLAVYFKTSAELPLGRPAQTRGAAFFVSYEYGILPPFGKDSLSTFKVGLRVQADGWRGQVR